MQMELFVDKQPSIEIRLNLVEETTEKVRLSTTKVRKCLFAEMDKSKKGIHNLLQMHLELQKRFDEMQIELKQLKEAYDVHRNSRQLYIYGKDAFRDGSLFAREANEEAMATA